MNINESVVYGETKELNCIILETHLSLSFK